MNPSRKLATISVAALRRRGLSTATAEATSTSVVRNDWTKDEIKAIYEMPMMELVYRAATVHRQFFNPNEVQQCTLLSVKTGGCTEDCKYCPQSSKHKTEVKPTPMMKVQEVLAAAQRAKDAGSTRFCMGVAWRDVGEHKDKNAFGSILEMVKGIKGMGLEVCCTLGMLTPNQAVQLKDAGLTAYNHNLDTSREYYPEIITTRTYDDRLNTIKNVRAAGISVCSGGIVGLGEQETDRVGLLHTLATMEEHPESVPINGYVKVKGTELSLSPDAGLPPALDMVRMIATARILMPKSKVRLSAGRMSYTEAEQALMFSAGANSIFYGDKLLTTSNPGPDEDKLLFAKLGLNGIKPFSDAEHAAYLAAQQQADDSNSNSGGGCGGGGCGSGKCSSKQQSLEEQVVVTKVIYPKKAVAEEVVQKTSSCSSGGSGGCGSGGGCSSKKHAAEEEEGEMKLSFKTMN